MTRENIPHQMFHVGAIISCTISVSSTIHGRTQINNFSPYSQRGNDQVSVHLHTKAVPLPSTQVPPCAQGFFAHALSRENHVLLVVLAKMPVVQTG